MALTRDILWLAIAGALICITSTTGAYLVRKSRDPIEAKQRLIVDPFLYIFEFILSSVVIHYVFLR